MNDYLDKTDTFMSGLGVEVYRVGGSVRDELLGRRVKDADYMVRGVSLNGLFDLLQSQGREYKVTPLNLRDGRTGGARVHRKGLGLIEIMLPRTDVPRAPKAGENAHSAVDIVVDPNLTLADDSKRRDFTFNALYKPIHPDLAGLTTEFTVIDPTARGMYDLSHKLIQTTHRDSFRDDPLRTLRALRFVSTLGYDLTADTLEQMREYAECVTGLSIKGFASGTVLNELEKLLMGDDPAKALRLARDTGVLAAAFPELAPMIGFDQGSRYHDMTTDEHTFTALETAAHVDAPLRVRLALLFHDAGKPATAWTGKDGRKHYYKAKAHTSEDEIDPHDGHIQMDHEEYGEILWNEAAVRLGATRESRREVATLIRNHMVSCEKANPTKVRRNRVRLGDDMLCDLYMMRLCDLSGKGAKNRKFMENVARMEEIRQDAQAAGVPAAVGDLAISGRDIVELGATGVTVGYVLRAVLDEVVVDPTGFKLTRQWQMHRAFTHVKEEG